MANLLLPTEVYARTHVYFSRCQWRVWVIQREPLPLCATVVRIWSPWRTFLESPYWCLSFNDLYFLSWARSVSCSDFITSKVRVNPLILSAQSFLMLNLTLAVKTTRSTSTWDRWRPTRFTPKQLNQFWRHSSSSPRIIETPIVLRTSELMVTTSVCNANWRLVSQCKCGTGKMKKVTR